MSQRNDNRKLKKVEVPFFRAARSVSGTRRRVTTDELEEFKSESVAPPIARGSRPSIPAIPTPWLSGAPSAPPPPSPWVPGPESMLPPAAPKSLIRPAAKPVAVTNDALRAGMLSGIAGFVDAAGFLSLFGLLPAHMTGDLVWAGAAVADRADVGWSVRFAMMFLFVAAVAVAAVAARIMRRRGQSPLASLLTLMTLALGVFWAAGTALGPLVSGPDAAATLFISGAGVAAMGIQNALMREALGTLCPTTVMTGNLTQVTMDLVELVFASFDVGTRRPELRRKEALARLSRFSLPIASFTFGAVAGACAITAFGFASLAAPTLASLVLTVHSFRVAARSA